MGNQLFLLFSVEDVDLAFLRSTEDITHDQKAFLNDSEWELLSVSSTYSILQNSAGDFAQIQFNVGSTPIPVPVAHFSAVFHLPYQAEQSLLSCIFSFVSPKHSWFGWLQTSVCIWDQRFSHRSWTPAGVVPYMNIKRMVFRHRTPNQPLPGVLTPFSTYNILTSNCYWEGKRKKKPTHSNQN